jgi:hypothetical protein
MNILVTVRSAVGTSEATLVNWDNAIFAKEDNGAPNQRVKIQFVEGQVIQVQESVEEIKAKLGEGGNK